MIIDDVGMGGGEAMIFGCCGPSPGPPSYQERSNVRWKIRSRFVTHSDSAPDRRFTTQNVYPLPCPSIPTRVLCGPDMVLPHTLTRPDSKYRSQTLVMHMW
jgi:hypothetical protein